LQTTVIAYLDWNCHYIVSSKSAIAIHGLVAALTRVDGSGFEIPFGSATLLFGGIMPNAAS
jgi:hypothetical protein